MKDINSFLPKITKKIEQENFTFFKMVNNWERVVGEDFAKYLTLEKITWHKSGKCTIVIKTKNTALIPILKHKEQEIINNASVIFGKKFIEKVIYTNS